MKVDGLVKTFSSDSINTQQAITEEGFLMLMKLFIQKDHPESNWVMLRSLGQSFSLMNIIIRYDEDLAWKVQPSDVSIQTKGKILDWNEDGIQYLLQVIEIE